MEQILINVEDLTLKQIREISALVIGGEKKQEPHHLIDSKVIIRTYSSGVHFGTLIKKDGLECVLSDSIRIWYWDGAASLSQLAIDGVLSSKESNCKFSVKVPSVDLQWIEIIPCSDKSIRSIEGVKSWVK